MKTLYLLLIIFLCCISFKSDRADATIWVYVEGNKTRVRSEFYMEKEEACRVIGDHFKQILTDTIKIERKLDSI